MVEPQRLESLTRAEPADRDSRAEALLVDGLDRYFAGDYEQAIHIWTRVLFLDRAHARARAYIDRARTAIAERQRRAEEMLQAGAEQLDRGQPVEARRLLAQAVAENGEDERAAALRLRIERMERARRAAEPRDRRAVLDAEPVRSPRRLSWLGVTAGAAVAIGLALVALVGRPVLRQWLGVGVTERDLATVSGVVTSPSLSPSDVALARAKDFYARGHFVEALQALDRVEADSADRPVADQLRREIQQLEPASGRELTPATVRTDVKPQ